MILDDPALTNGLLSWITENECAVPWMYLDTAKEKVVEGKKSGGPIVTVGVGIALQNKSMVQNDWFDLCDVTTILAGRGKQSWQQLAGKIRRANSTGKPTAKQVSDVYEAVQGRSHQQVKSGYKLSAGSFIETNLVENGAKKTLLRFTEGPMNGELVKHLRADAADLTRIFPDFDTFPSLAQSALLDMIYNLGGGRDADGKQKATGFRQFHKLIAAAQEHDWKAVADHAHRNGPSEARNRETKNRFLLASVIEPPRPRRTESSASPTPFGPPAPMRDPFAPPPRNDTWAQPQPIYRPN